MTRCLGKCPKSGLWYKRGTKESYPIWILNEPDLVSKHTELLHSQEWLQSQLQKREKYSLRHWNRSTRDEISYPLDMLVHNTMGRNVTKEGGRMCDY